jgi:signal transduction histidine kinase
MSRAVGSTRNGDRYTRMTQSPKAQQEDEQEIHAQSQADEELAEQQRRLYDLFMQAPAFIYLVRGPEYVFEFANAMFLQLIGNRDIIGKSLRQAFPETGGSAEYFELLDHIVATGEPYTGQEVKVVMGQTEDGAPIENYFNFVYQPAHNAEGNVDGILVHAVDVTKQVRFNQELQDLNANLETIVAQRTAVLNQVNMDLQRSNQELQEFAYVASHDLQEPLRKIQAFGNLLEEEYGEVIDGGKAYLDRMRNAATRMRVLIDDLLTFSRVTTKAQPFASVDLNVVAREVVDDLEAKIQATHGTIEVGELPTIDADPLQMRQLLQNLIGNALKFQRRDVPPVVKISAEVVRVSGELREAQTEQEEQEKAMRTYCRLSVEDNGIGFDEKYLDRIFIVFQRLHGKSEYEGTGIGLAVVRKIVERHSGTITARSTPGQGSTFIVTLPVHAASESEALEALEEENVRGE